FRTRMPGGHRGSGLPTEIYVPRLHYRSGYALGVTGAAVTSPPASGLLALCAPRRSSFVAIRITPDRGGATGSPTGKPNCSPSTRDSVSADPSNRSLTISRRGGEISLTGLVTARMPPPRTRCLRSATIRIQAAKGTDLPAVTLKTNRRLVRLH